MDAKDMAQDKISAFVDGELDDDQVDIALSVLRSEYGRENWDLYHQIGDTLRSEELAFNMSPDFSARLAARLEAEPTILGSVTPVSQSLLQPTLAQHEQQRAANDDATGRFFGKFTVKKFAFGSMAAVVAASITLVAAPSLMVALNGVNEDGPKIVYLADSNSSSQMVSSQMQKMVGGLPLDASNGAAQASVAVMVNQNDGMLRDTRIDDYLAAHQRFSPSVYSTAQYARSAAFVSDSEK